MKIIIRADANTQIGIGHVMRCIALGQAWKKKGGKVVFISACESNSLKNRITDEGFELVPHEKPCPDPDDLLTTLAIINNQKTTNDWIVLDGYHFDTEYQQSIKKNGNSLLVIDDMAHLDHYTADIILNQNINAEELSYSCEPETQLLLGTDYVLLRDEFLAYQNWRRKIPEVAKKILVTMGGSDPYNVTVKVLEALNLVDVTELEIKVVIGTSNPHFNALKKAVKNTKHNMELLQNIFNISELMAWADMAVSSCGITSWELAFMGLPAILIITASNQQWIAAGLNRFGAAANLGWYSDISTKLINNQLNELLLKKGIRSNMNRKGIQLVDELGAKRLIDKMIT